MRQSSLILWSAMPFLKTSRHVLANDQKVAGTWARMAWLSGRGVPSRAQRSNSAIMAGSLIVEGSTLLMRGFDIVINLQEEIVAAPGVGVSDFQLMPDADMLPQHGRASNGSTVFQ